MKEPHLQIGCALTHSLFGWLILLWHKSVQCIGMSTCAPVDLGLLRHNTTGFREWPNFSIKSHLFANSAAWSSQRAQAHVTQLACSRLCFVICTLPTASLLAGNPFVCLVLKSQSKSIQRVAVIVLCEKQMHLNKGNWSETGSTPKLPFSSVYHRHKSCNTGGGGVKLKFSDASRVFQVVMLKKATSTLFSIIVVPQSGYCFAQ